MKLSKLELAEALGALLIAIILQVILWQINNHIFSQPQYVILIVESVLAILLVFSSNMTNPFWRKVQHAAAILLLAIMSLANFTALAFIIYALIASGSTDGIYLLGSALAIFGTNIIVYALWYWEIDSPGLTNRKWTKSDKDFQFEQQTHGHEFSGWKPEFIDYLYISIINSVNGATTSAHPLSRQAKSLMATQAVISIFTLALVIARSVSILGS